MRVLYQFGDNDFGTTFMEVFRIILRTMESGLNHNKELFRDKQVICKMINELAYPLYQVVQNRSFPLWDDDRFSTEAECRAFYENYLRATPDKIYIDKEIDELLAVYGDGNSAWFVLDTDQHNPEWRVYAV